MKLSPAKRPVAAPALPPPRVQRPSESESRAKRRAKGRDIGPVPDVVNPDRRDACRLSLLHFCLTYLAARFPLEFSADHLRVIESLQRVTMEGALLALAMPRGSGKTTLVEAAALWALVYGHRRFCFVVAADAEAANDLVVSIRGELEFNELLAEDFPDATFPIRQLGGIARRAEGQTSDGAPTHLVWTRGEVRLPCMAAGGGSVIRATGITGRVRGAKATLSDGSQVRPDMVLIDDPQTDESAQSPNQVARRLKVIRSSVLGLAGPGQKIACLATVTIIAKGDLAEQLLDRKAHPEWQGHTGRILNSMPKNMELWDRYADIVRDDLAAERDGSRATAFYVEHKSDMDAGAEASWPARYAAGEASAIQHAMNLRIVRGEDAFAAEYMNAPLDLSSAAELDQLTPDAVRAKVTAIPAGIVPSEAVELTAGIDVGEHLLWWWVNAWWPGFGGHCVAYGAYPDPGRTYFTATECRGSLARAHPGGSWKESLTAGLKQLTKSLMEREWSISTGKTMRIGLALIDANYGDSTDTVYAFVSRSPYRERLHPSHGRGIKTGDKAMADWALHPGDKLGDDWILRRGQRQVPGVMFDADAWKSAFAGRILSPAGAADCLGIAAGNHRMMSEQVSAEYRVRVSAKGKTKDEWRPRPNRDNHLFDAGILATVAGSMRGIKLDRGESAERAKEAEAVVQAAKEAVAKRATLPVGGGGGGGWMDGFGGNGGGW